MCGIVGLFGFANTPNAKKIFEQMHIVDQLRGDDSCGIAILSNKSVTTVKDIVYPSQLHTYKKYNKAWANNEVVGYIGHNRYATKGEVNVKNAHPFTHGAITLVHNGTVHSLDDFPKELKGRFETDSELICYCIDKYGIDKTWNWVGYGAATLVWFDARDKTLNIISNGQRPINWGYNEGEDVLYFASEPWMIWSITSRNDVKLRKEKPVVFPPDNELHTFKYDKKVTSTTRKIKKESKVWENRVSQYTDGWWFNRQQQNQNVLPFHKSKEELKVVNLTDKKMTEEEFQTNYPFCAGCGTSLHFDFKDAVILDDDNAICHECTMVANETGQDMSGKLGNILH